MQLRLVTCKLYMVFMLEPEIGIPIPPDMGVLDLKDRAEAAFATALELEEHGADLNPNAEDKDVAAKLALAYAENPEKISRRTSNKQAATLTPASLVMTNNILQEFGQSVAQSAKQIRHLVTNKLILETESPDSRTRLRALELLGKISDVSLFAEKSEVTITHQSTQDIRENLRIKLKKLVDPTEEAEDAVILDGEVLDLDAELGLKNE